MEDITLHVKFKNRVMTLEEYLSFSKDLLVKLGQFHEVFRNVFSWSGNEEHWKIGFNGDYHFFEETIYEQGIGDDQVAYENPDPSNKELTFESKSFVDFINSYSNVVNDSNDQFVIRIIAGSSMKDSKGIINIDFPTNPESVFYQYDFIKCLMGVIIESVDPVYAVISSDAFIDEVEGVGNDFWIGWMTYIAHTDLEMYLDNVYEIKTFENGTWFAISNEVPCSEDETLVDKAISIREKLEEGKLLSYKT